MQIHIRLSKDDLLDFENTESMIIESYMRSYKVMSLSSE
jgi:hypothetical protein